MALLSVFALPSVVELMLPGGGWKVDVRALTSDALRASMIFGLAHEIGDEIGSVRGQPLRRLLELMPSYEYLNLEEYKEPHRRGEVLSSRNVDGLYRDLGCTSPRTGRRQD